MERECRHCLATKPLTDFELDRRRPSGRTHTCLACSNARKRRWEALPHAKEAKSNRRRRRRAEYAEYSRRYYRSHPDRALAATRRWRKGNPEKFAAHAALNAAVRKGLITKGACEVCGATSGVDGHHDDYSKPLEVRWLCHPCHEHICHSAA